MPPLTPEQKIDSDKRIKEFKDEMISLSERLQVDIFNYPQYIPNNDGTFRLAIMSDFMDKKHLPIPSVMSDEIIKK